MGIYVAAFMIGKTWLWVASAYTQYFVFMYDRSFYTPEEGYRVEAFIEDKKQRFGGVDSVILWPAYPRIGVDDRNQYDFFRDLPGGLDGVRDVCRRFQREGRACAVALSSVGSRYATGGRLR